jgi:hypothetical protein
MKERTTKRLSQVLRAGACLCLLATFAFAFIHTTAAGKNGGGRLEVSFQDSATWHEFSPEGEEFTVLLPQRARITEGKRFFGDRQRDYEFRLYRVFAGNTLFTVESYEGDKPKDLARIVMSGRRALNSQASIELNGFKGNEFTHDVEGLSFKGRCFATRKHVYVVEAAKRGAYDPAMDQFLNSFSLAHKSVEATTDPAWNTPTASSADEVFETRKVSSKAIILAKLPATYTDNARERMIRGTVVVQAVLRASGEVSDIEVRAGLPEGLTKQSIEATKAIVFVPAERDGKPISTRVLLEYNFSIY